MSHRFFSLSPHLCTPLQNVLSLWSLSSFIPLASSQLCLRLCHQPILVSFHPAQGPLTLKQEVQLWLFQSIASLTWEPLEGEPWMASIVTGWTGWQLCSYDMWYGNLSHVLPLTESRTSLQLFDKAPWTVDEFNPKPSSVELEKLRIAPLSVLFSYVVLIREGRKIALQNYEMCVHIKGKWQLVAVSRSRFSNETPQHASDPLFSRIVFVV